MALSPAESNSLDKPSYSLFVQVVVIVFELFLVLFSAPKQSPHYAVFCASSNGFNRGGRRRSGGEGGPNHH
jgi:hypothetical protein